MTAARIFPAVVASAVLLTTFACVGDDPESSSSSSSSGGSSSGGSSSGGSSSGGSSSGSPDGGDAGCPNGVCPPSPIKQASVGAALACAVREDGTIWCWGRGAFGGLGKKFESVNDGEKCNDEGSDHRCSAKAVQVMGVPPADSVIVNLDSACAVTKSKEVWCWGRNTQGETGSIASTTSCQMGPCVVPPAKIEGVANASRAALGISHACALSLDGNVSCWGDNALGRLGRGTLTPDRDAKPVIGLPANAATAISISTDAAAHTCVLAGNVPWCWGGNGGLALGYTTPNTTANCNGNCSSTPKQATETGISAAGGFTHLATGAQHTCVVTFGTSDLYCWGYHGYHAGTIGSAPSLTARLVASDVSTVAGRSAHACLIKKDGTIACWGVADAGKLGYIVPPPVPHCLGNAGIPWTCNDGTPVAVPFNNAVAIDANDNSMAFGADGKLYVWGTNATGLIGQPLSAVLKTCQDTAGNSFSCTNVPTEIVLP